MLSCPAAICSFGIPTGMKINSRHARMRPQAGSPLSAARPCVLLWVHSVYPLQVMPDADKGPPLPVLCLDLYNRGPQVGMALGHLFR